MAISPAPVQTTVLALVRDYARLCGKTVGGLRRMLTLCRRYRMLVARGKRSTVVTTAIAREMAAFLWAIAREVAPRAA